MIGNELMHRRNVILFLLVSVFYFIQLMVGLFIGGFGRVLTLGVFFIVFGLIPLVLIYKRVNPKITMYVMVISMYLFLSFLLNDSPYLVNYLYIWLALPLSAIYQKSRLVVLAGIASILITFYAFFYLHDEIFPNVAMEDFVYFVMFGVFTTTFLLIFIHKIREVNEKLQRLAYHDPLTGAANRLLLKEKFILLKSSKVHSIAIFFIDMNDFKKINDTYGHEVGDQLLERVVAKFNGVLRDTDLLCRLGGDEFVILSSNIDKPILECLLEQIHYALDKPIVLNQLTIKISASIGWSYTQEVAHADLENMIRDADRAMYRVKGSQLKGNHSLDNIED